MNRASKTRQVLRQSVPEAVSLELIPLTVGACGWCRLGERHGGPCGYVAKTEPLSSAARIKAQPEWSALNLSSGPAVFRLQA